MNANEIRTEALDQLVSALCALGTKDEAHAFLCDLLTPREMQDLAQRLEVATLLNAGVSYMGVSRLTGASSTTVSRVSKCLNGPGGGYRLVLDRLDTQAPESAEPED